MKKLPLLPAALFAAGFVSAQEIFRMPVQAESRVSSFENLNGLKGQGAPTNRGAKGNAFETLKAGESKTLLDVKGAGVVQRIWLTVRDRTPEMLRALRLQMFWDGATEPAVDVPLGDFFCAGLGRPTAFQSVFFSNPEGRSFNCCIPMPFRQGARVVLVNESKSFVPHVFFDIDFVQQPLPEDALYFHAYWSRQKVSSVGQDFELLPRVTGRGRFLGTSVGVNTNPAYAGTWYGEGEVKMFLDGDTAAPTIVGTGTEDYIGTGWGEGTFAHLYQGCTIADEPGGHFAFYRFHVPDTIFFHHDFRATLQQIGGGDRDLVVGLIKQGVPLRPVSAASADSFVRLLDESPAPDLHAEKFAGSWVNFYRTDDYSATSYFYLDRPTSGLPRLVSEEERRP